MAPDSPAAGAGQQAPGACHPFPPPVFDLDGARHPDELYRPLYGATIGQAVLPQGRRLLRPGVPLRVLVAAAVPYVGSLVVLILTLQAPKVEGRRFDPYQR